MLKFPDCASAQERSTEWPKIAEISDTDFGFNTPKPQTDQTRFAVRILLTNDQNQFCVIQSTKYGYCQIPGGGIDEGETITEAQRRETREEAGFLIKDIKPLGYVIENRGDLRNHHSWDRSQSYVFTASTDQAVGTDYMADEIAEGFQPTWLELPDLIAAFEKSEGKIESYSGCFANRRDLKVAKYYASIQNLR